MKTTVVTIAFCMLALLAPVHAFAAKTDPGSVQIPLTDYTQLIDLTRDPVIPAPNGYALGEAQVQVNVTRSKGRATAIVQVNLSVEILEAKWVSVPILPGGTPVDFVKIGGSPVQLANTEDGLTWGRPTLGPAPGSRYGADKAFPEGRYDDRSGGWFRSRRPSWSSRGLPGRVTPPAS